MSMFDIKIIRVPQIERFTQLGYACFRIDRTTVVGNPFPMHNKSQEERDRVCDAYQEYFNKKVADKTDKAFMDYLRVIYKATQSGPVALACWCAPLRCHGETIKAFIEQFK